MITPFTTITSQVVPLLVDNIDTDQIIPAEFLKVTNKVGLGQHVFSNWRQDSNFVLNQPQYRDAQILLAGANFGCGSSREHAPWALLDHGFKVIIAESFADIFKNNALNNGLLPVAVPRDISAQFTHLPMTVNLVDQTLTWSDQTFHFEINAFNKNRLLKGVDDIGYTLTFNEQITAYEHTHPRSAR